MMTDAEKSSKDYGYSGNNSLETGVQEKEIQQPTGEYDAVFGEYKEGQVHYKSVGWCVVFDDC